MLHDVAEQLIAADSSNNQGPYESQSATSILICAAITLTCLIASEASKDRRIMRMPSSRWLGRGASMQPSNGGTKTWHGVSLSNAR